MNKFKELRVWQEAAELAVDVYKITKHFPSEEKFGLVSQINRTVISISSNIAEGAGRNTKKDFSQFLSIAIGSTFELESQLLISQKLNFISEEDLEKILSQILLIQNMLFKLKRSLIEEKSVII